MTHDDPRWPSIPSIDAQRARQKFYGLLTILSDAGIIDIQENGVSINESTLRNVLDSMNQAEGDQHDSQ